MDSRVGRAIPVEDVVSRTTNLLMQAPALLLPQVLILVLGLIGDVFSRLGLLITILEFAVSFVVAGAYPPMVKAILEGRPFSAAECMRIAIAKYWTLLIAGVLVGFAVILGFVAFIVPGIVIGTWYAYTVPSIMLENKGAMAGMTASKAFGRDKKWSTFLIFLLVAAAAVVIFVLQTLLSMASPLLGRVVSSFLYVPLYAWIFAVFPYTYLTYGPSSAPQEPSETVYGVVPPVQPQPVALQPEVQTNVSPTMNYCRFCGSPLEPGSQFCSSCGKAL